MDATEEKRLKREHAQFVSNRKGRGKARVRVIRTPVANDGNKRVSGHAIVIRPLSYNRDRLRAFIHWCKSNGITIAPCESTTRQGEGFPEQKVDIAYLAFCPDSESMDALKGHDYVGKGRWQYATSVSVGSHAKLAPEPKKPVKESELCPFPGSEKGIALQEKASN